MVFKQQQEEDENKEKNQQKPRKLAMYFNIACT